MSTYCQINRIVFSLPNRVKFRYFVHDWNTYCNFKLATVNINDDESNIPLIVHMGIPIEKRGINDNESLKNSLLPKILIINQSLQINSFEDIRIIKACLYDINGRIFESLNIDNEYSRTYNINLNFSIPKLGRQTFYFQLIYSDKDNKQHILNYKFLNNGGYYE